MLSQTLFILLVTPCFANADKVESTADRICKEISSNKYESQCRSTLWKGFFDHHALNLCFKHNVGNYNTAFCVSAIKNKVFNKSELAQCEQLIDLEKQRKVTAGGALICFKQKGASLQPPNIPFCKLNDSANQPCTKSFLVDSIFYTETEVATCLSDTNSSTYSCLLKNKNTSQTPKENSLNSAPVKSHQ